MDKQSMYNDYIDAKRFQKIVNDENLTVSIAVKINLSKAKTYKQFQKELSSHVENELLIDKSIAADQQRNYYVWNAIQVARLENKLGVDLINDYDNLMDMLISKYTSLKLASLSELKLLMTMEHYRSELIKLRKKNGDLLL